MQAGGNDIGDKLKKLCQISIDEVSPSMNDQSVLDELRDLMGEKIDKDKQDGEGGFILQLKESQRLEKEMLSPEFPEMKDG